SQWPRSPARGCGRMSSSPATAIHPAPCISRPSTGRPQSRASTARHGSEMLPTLGFPSHPSDKIAQLASDLWPSCPLPRFPAPERRETNTMPAKDGLRLNDMRRTEQAWPESGQPHHQGPVTAAQSKARRRTPQGDAELMAKEQVLDFKSPRRLEEVYNEHYERMQEREHRPRSCADSTRRCDSQAGWNFRKAQAQRGDGRHASGDRPRQGAWPHRAVFARAPVAAYR